MISESTGTLPNASTMASRFAFALTLAVRFVFGLAGMARPPGVPAMAERRAAVRGAVNGDEIFRSFTRRLGEGIPRPYRRVAFNFPC
jgi:hypothetical protein